MSKRAAPEIVAVEAGARVPRALAGLAVLALLVLLVHRVGGEIPRFAAWIGEQGAWAPLFYVLGYIALTTCFVPGALPTMAAGVVFGIGPGTIYAFAGETLGGAAAFLLARSVARPLVEARLARSALFVVLDRAIAHEGRRIVFMLRLSPAVPFSALNYALGLTKLRFDDYLVASIGMLPSALLYVYYGKLLGDVAALASGAEIPRDAVYWTATLVGLLTTMAVSVVLARIATRALREASRNAPPSTAIAAADTAAEAPPRARRGTGSR